ncbi:glycosyltransferase family 4 protein [soil metagenome]
MKLAYLSSPGLFGLFTVCRNLRAGLEPLGVELRWVGHGTWAKRVLENPQWESERSRGDVVGGDSEDFDFLGKQLVHHLIDQGYDGVITSPPQDLCQMNVVRYLPDHFTRILVAQSNALGVFRPLRGLRDYVHAAVGVSPGVRDGLIGYAKMDPARTTVIGNAGNMALYEALVPRTPSKTLRLLSFGRIEERQKGIFWLPQILSLLTDLDVHLTIGGDGVHMSELKSRCAPYADRVTFLGLVPTAKIPALIGSHDVFILPSRYEGLPSALIESMAGGCVPVASRIEGVTDYVLRDNENGRLFTIGDVATAAKMIRSLAEDRDSLARLSSAAVASVQADFSAQVMGRSYFDLIQKVRNSPPVLAKPLSLDAWDYPSSFRAGIGRWMPQPIKAAIRSMLRR